MKSVHLHILQHERRYAQLPFFDFLRDDGLSATARLSFLPCMAPFVLAFADLNRYVLRVEPTDDPYQQLINARTCEDDHHWPCYLEDYAKLGHDLAPQAPSETMRELWSDAMAASRMLSHHLAHLVWGAETVVRLALIDAIGQTGNVLFGLTIPLAETVRRETGVRLRYCGAHHLRLQNGPATNDALARMARLDLTPLQRQSAFARVDTVFDLFAHWTEELHRFAKAQLEADAALDRGVLMQRQDTLRSVTAW